MRPAGVSCFPEPGRGNHASSVPSSELATDVYVELYSEDDRGIWLALWLHSKYEDITLKLAG